MIYYYNDFRGMLQVKSCGWRGELRWFVRICVWYWGIWRWKMRGI